MPEGHDPVRVGIRERTKQHAVHDAEDRRVRPDTETYSCDHERREHRLAGEAAQRVPNILPEHRRAPRISVGPYRPPPVAQRPQLLSGRGHEVIDDDARPGQASFAETLVMECEHRRPITLAKRGGIEPDERADQSVSLHARDLAMIPRPSAYSTSDRKRSSSAASTRRPSGVSR